MFVNNRCADNRKLKLFLRIQKNSSIGVVFTIDIPGKTWTEIR